MRPLSKVWGYWLFVLQLLNAALGTLSYLGAMQLPADVQAKVLTWNFGIAAVVGALQAFAEALPDADGDGTPDLFDDTPQGG